MKGLALPLRALFSVWTWVASFAVMGLGVVGTIVLLMLGIPYQKVHVWVTAPFFASCLRMAAVRLHVHYHPDFDPKTRAVFVQNHVNIFDGMLAAAVIPHAFSGLMLAWQFKIPIYGWLMSLAKGIPVDKKLPTAQILKNISDAARERRRIGMSVLSFPEGRRTRDGSLGSFRPGVFTMAARAEMPVVPIAAKGMYGTNNKRQGWLITPFQRVDVFVGPAFIPPRSEDVASFKQKIYRYIDHCLEHGEFPAEARERDLREAPQCQRPSAAE